VIDMLLYHERNKSSKEKLLVNFENLQRRKNF